MTASTSNEMTRQLEMRGKESVDTRNTNPSAWCYGLRPRAAAGLRGGGRGCIPRSEASTNLDSRSIRLGPADTDHHSRFGGSHAFEDRGLGSLL